MADHSSAIIPTLQNITATLSLDCSKLDLKAIALQARNAEYNPKRLPAVIMRIREPKTTALIFATGKIVSTGAKSEHENTLELYKSLVILELSLRILKSRILLLLVMFDFLCHCSQCFLKLRTRNIPWIGVSYETTENRAAGKIVITGAKVRDDTYAAFDNIYPVLTQFRKKSRQ